MIKNRTVQLIYQTIYCTIGLIGTIASLGIFDDINNIRWDFYVHFTNISNFFCIAVMVIALIATIKRKGDDYVKACPVFKFIGVLSILLTFLVFNLVLAGSPDRDPQLNWRIGSLSFHVVLPIMYVAHWVLFYEHRKVKWTYPLYSILFPFAYVVFILIQAVILQFDRTILIPNGSDTPLIYPYFFLDIDEQGPMVIVYILGLLVGFVALGYAFYGIDRLLKQNKK
jgi:hypothetical protein